MSDDDPNNQLVRVEHGLALTSLAENRIISEMVDASLVLASDSAVAPVELDALVVEGKRLCNGEEFTEEIWEATDLFLQAAEAGHSEAQFLMFQCGQLLHHRLARMEGHGIELNAEGLFEWLRKSAESGFAAAQYSLGCLYRDGQNVPQDYVEADKWFRKAAEQGNRDAQYELGYYLISDIPWDNAPGGEFGEEAEQGYIEALKWLHKAAEQGQPKAQWALGFYYCNGSSRLAFSRDTLKAYKWLQLAADQGQRHARGMAEGLAAKMSPSELEAAQQLYREFKDNCSE